MVLAIVVPLGSPLLLPLAPFFLAVTSARLARYAFAAESAWRAFALAAAVVPVGFLIGVLVVPAASFLAAGIASGLVALPCLALYVAGRDGRRRDEVLLVVAAVAAVAGLAAVLGFALAEGRNPGELLAARFGEMIPEQLAAHRKAGISESAILLLSRLYEAFRALLAGSLEGLVLAAAVVYATLLVYPASTALGLTFGMSASSFGSFTTPPLAAILFVPAGLVAALAKGPPAWLAVDLLLPLVVLFFLRGLAIIRVLLDRGRAGLVGRALIYVVLFWGPFPLLLALGGLFDEFLDIRGRIEKAAASRDDGE